MRLPRANQLPAIVQCCVTPGEAASERTEATKAFRTSISGISIAITVPPGSPGPQPHHKIRSNFELTQSQPRPADSGANFPWAQEAYCSNSWSA